MPEYRIHHLLGRVYDLDQVHVLRGDHALADQAVAEPADDPAPEGLVHEDDRNLAATILKSGIAKALELQKEHGRMRLALFAAFFNGGQSLDETPYDQVLKLLRDTVCAAKPEHITVVETVYDTFANACRTVREKNWEGLVVYDSHYLLTYRTDGGDPPRDRKSTRLNSSHLKLSRMPSSA